MLRSLAAVLLLHAASAPLWASVGRERERAPERVPADVARPIELSNEAASEPVIGSDAAGKENELAAAAAVLEPRAQALVGEHSAFLVLPDFRYAASIRLNFDGTAEFLGEPSDYEKAAGRMSSFNGGGSWRLDGDRLALDLEGYAIGPDAPAVAERVKLSWSADLSKRDRDTVPVDAFGVSAAPWVLDRLPAPAAPKAAVDAKFAPSNWTRVLAVCLNAHGLVPLVYGFAMNHPMLQAVGLALLGTGTFLLLPASFRPSHPADQDVRGAFGAFLIMGASLFNSFTMLEIVSTGAVQSKVWGLAAILAATGALHALIERSRAEEPDPSALPPRNPPNPPVLAGWAASIAAMFWIGPWIGTIALAAVALLAYGPFALRLPPARMRALLLAAAALIVLGTLSYCALSSDDDADAAPAAPAARPVPAPSYAPQPRGSRIFLP